MPEESKPKQDKVKAALASGFRDYGPSEMIARERMIATIKASFERFGFDPLGTPGIELLSVLTGNNPDFR